MFPSSPSKVFAVIAISIAIVGLRLPEAACAQQRSVSSTSVAGQRVGVYLLMQLDTGDLLKKWMETVANDVQQTLRQNEIGYTGLAATREPILGGAGQISGNFTVEEASRVALLIRSGTLPAKLNILEERALGGNPEGQPR